MLDLPAATVQDLRETLLLPEPAIEAIRLAMPIIEGVCDRAAREFDEDEGDDANLFGQQCSRRSRNLIAREIDGVKPTGVTATRPRGSLVVNGGGVAMYFWAAGDTDGSPRLKGGKTKPQILDACLQQLRLWDTAAPTEPPSHIVVAYRATPAAQGLVKMVAGLPRAADRWERAVALMDETGVYDGSVTVTSRVPVERFDAEQPAAPVIKLRPREKHGDSDN